MYLEKSPKISYKFSCEFCCYYSNKQSEFNKHLMTVKHNRLVNASKMLEDASKNISNTYKQFICDCGKSYSHDSSYYRHKKNCTGNHNKKESNVKEEANDKNNELIEYLMKENKEMKELILEIVKNTSIATTSSTINTNSHNTTTNSHNKAFNLQFFLNETCKNAMNITDFVESIKLQLSDFMSMGELGFVEGISNIIVKNLNSLDETVRPIHCTDQKRETFYVKDENQWEKEEDDRKKLKKMIRSIAYKNEKLMKKYKETYPDYNNSDSNRSDQYSKIMIEAMDCKEESREKIIRNISKATTIKSKP
jgi:hypothetical protein